LPLGGAFSVIGIQWMVVSTTAAPSDVCLMVIGAIFGLVNAIIGPVIKVLAFPLYIITFGLISFVINGFLLLLVAWISNLLGADVFAIDGFTSEGLEIASLGWAILAALVMSIASFFTRTVLKVLKIR
jgi:putative membrane protein